MPLGQRPPSRPLQNREKRTSSYGAILERTRQAQKKIFCFFVEMVFVNDYKCCVIDTEILRFSWIPFRPAGNKVSRSGTVSYPMAVHLLYCKSKSYFKEGGFES